MAKKVLIVTKDIGEFNVYEPVVRALREHDVEVAVIAEGLSKQKWSDTGRLTISGEAFAEPEINDLFVHNKPNLVLTGLGAPINLGEKFGLAANAHGVKLGYVHDLWGVHKRSSAIPQFVCVTDDFDKKLVESYEPYKERMPKVYVTGSPAMDALQYVQRDERVGAISDLAAQTVLVLGQDESTTPMLEGLISALDECADERGYLLIPRLHPKFMSRPELCGKWLSLLYGAKRGKVLFVEPAVTTRQLMQSSQFTVSVYSTGLIEAAMLGSLAVSWVSPLGREKMRESLGVERYPLVDLQCADEVETVQQWKDVWDVESVVYDEIVDMASQRLRADGQNTARVVDVILKQVE